MIDYGQDAPGLMRGFFLGGVLAVCAAVLSGALAPAPWAGLAAGVLGLVALYLLGMGSFMVWESRNGKVRDRDLTLGQLPWRGDETVLDVGCGRGLMLIGAALRLTTGHAMGIDLWRDEDQARNSASATLANAEAAGVAGKVSVRTADMVALPFGDAAFDMVLSSWAVHNLPDPDLRRKALAEMMRVLKPGGVLALTDIEGRQDYPGQLAALDARDIRVEVLHPWKDRIIGALSFGSFAPFTVYARKG